MGRDAELAHLHVLLEKAVSGERRLVFITGEAGIGKTTVIDAFLARLTAEPTMWLARGQCVEHHGAGEPYMPVLAALEQLCRTASDTSLLAFLRRCAPLDSAIQVMLASRRQSITYRIIMAFMRNATGRALPV